MKLLRILFPLLLSPTALAGDASIELAAPAVADHIVSREYEFSRQAGRLGAPNRATNLRSTLQRSGLVVAPRDGTGGWALQLELTHVGRVGAFVALERVEPSAVGNLATWEHERVREWCSNTAHGIQHGFALDQRPLGDGPLILRMRWSGLAAAQVRAGGRDVMFLDDAQHDVVSYRGLVVRDRSGRELRAALRSDGEFIDIVIEDADALYPLDIDPIFELAGFSHQADVGSSLLGHSLAPAGDVNGDGFSDVVVGAPGFDSGGIDAGRVFVFHGGPAGLQTPAAFEFSGSASGNQLGYCVATAGDVNGDGFDDVIVGEPYADANGTPDSGLVHVFHGSASGLSAPAWTYAGLAFEAFAGWSVATAGDVNGDGYWDVVVGAPGSPSLAGGAFCFLGSSTGLGTNPAWAATDGPRVFGFAVATAGDVNADGFDDVIVGIPFSWSGGQVGEAKVYMGGPSGLAAAPAWTTTGWNPFSEYGSAVALAGDVNGDGYSDVAVGERDFQPGGRVHVFHGSATGLDNNPDWTHTKFGYPHWFGASVHTAGDVNGDGYADLIVGSPGKPIGGLIGEADVFFGSNDGLQAESGWNATFTEFDSYYGASVAGVGDVNGDGFGDVGVGAPRLSQPQAHEGGFWVFHGHAGAFGEVDPTEAVSHEGDLDLFASTVACLGDVNGDGFRDFGVGAQAEDGARGSARVYYGGRSGGIGGTGDWVQFGEAPGHYYGFGLADAGDVNGDGFDDVIVGAPFYSNGESLEGAAYLYLGSASGLSPSHAWRFEGDVPVAQLGFALARAGDVNGDGLSDVIVGAPGDTTQLGTAYVFLGTPAGLASTPFWTGNGTELGSQYGWSVCGGGDMNGDGLSDFAVGAPGTKAPDGTPNAGRAGFYLGHPTAPAHQLFYNTIYLTDGRLGHSIALADTDGDGYADLHMGIPYGEYSALDDSEGVTALYRGGDPLGGLVSWPAQSNRSLGYLGWSMSTAGDVNGDGIEDLVVGAPGPGDHGEVMLYLGSPSGLDPLPTWKHSQLGSVNWLGQSVSGGGDFNGDGFADAIGGQPTDSPDYSDTAFLYFGNSEDAGRSEIDRRPRQKRIGGRRAIGTLGQAVGQSVRLALVGHSPAGRAHVELEYQLAPAAADLEASALNATGVAPDTGAVGPLGSRARLWDEVHGLLPNASYRWRARATSSHPFFPRAPWFTLVGQSWRALKLRGSGQQSPLETQ